jgi:hypothetical protein
VNIVYTTEHTDDEDMPVVLKELEVESLLGSFPPTKLSYEVPVHKNDHSTNTLPLDSKCFIIPKGRRCIAWITEWKRKKICAIIEVQTQRNQIPATFRRFQSINGWYPSQVTIFDTCFHSTLAYGTVFGGVLFRSSSNGSFSSTPYFSINHIYWYKGDQIPSMTLSLHVQLCENIFMEKALRQVSYTLSNGIIFGLPVLCNSYDESLIQSFPYPVYSILYRSNSTTKIYYQTLFESALPRVSAPAPAPTPAPVYAHTRTPVHVAPARTVTREYIKPDDDMLTNIQAIFIVRPNIQNDIYELFVKPRNGNSGTVLATDSHAIFHNFAHIPNYKTSVMMNRLFRNIRENERLDTMEESEPEEDFENIDLDKYVLPDKEYRLVCKFNKKFCRWVPISVVTNKYSTEVITEYQVKQHEAQYINYRRR